MILEIMIVYHFSGNNNIILKDKKYIYLKLKENADGYFPHFTNKAIPVSFFNIFPCTITQPQQIDFLPYSLDNDR